MTRANLPLDWIDVEMINKLRAGTGIEPRIRAALDVRHLLLHYLKFDLGPVPIEVSDQELFSVIIRFVHEIKSNSGWIKQRSIVTVYDPLVNVDTDQIFDTRMSSL